MEKTLRKNASLATVAKFARRRSDVQLNKMRAIWRRQREETDLTLTEHGELNRALDELSKRHHELDEIATHLERLSS